jgi:hypothetical protein
MDVVFIYLAIKCCCWREEREELLLCTCVAKRLIVFLSCTLLGQCSGQRLHKIAIVVPENNVGEEGSCQCLLCTSAQDTMEPSRPKSMVSSNSLGLFSPRFCRSRLSRLSLCSHTLYRRWATITYHASYACPSLHHPLVGCPHLHCTTLLPQYRIPVSPHIYNFLTSSPSRG